MADKKVDLSRLKDEIHNRKQSKGSGDAEVNNGVGAKDEFLNGLVESLNTGRQTKATNLIRAVDTKASGDDGASRSSGGGTVNSEVQKFSTPKNSQTAPDNSPAPPADDDDREKKLYEEFERRKKEMLGGGPKMNQNQAPPTYSQQQVQPKQQLSEDKIYDVVDNAISQKFGSVVEQAMKDSIVEIYAEARMKEVLEENKDTIKKIVIEVIKELQKKKKS